MANSNESRNSFSTQKVEPNSQSLQFLQKFSDSLLESVFSIFNHQKFSKFPSETLQSLNCFWWLNMYLYSIAFPRLEQTFSHSLWEVWKMVFDFQNQFLNVMDLNSFSNFLFRLSQHFYRPVSFHWMYFG
jgi:hypothetical protein